MEANNTIWNAVIEDGGQWPTTHIFVPAIIAIYTRNIWRLLTAIYIFESVEFLVSQIPGLDYWSEVTNADTLVSDPVMALIGFFFVIVLDFKVPQKVSRFAFLSPLNIKAPWYAPLAPYLHVCLGGVSTLIGAAGIWFEFLPTNSPWEFISFAVLYPLVSLAFGFNELAAFMFANMVIITIICSFIAHTAPIATGAVFISTFAIYHYRQAYKRDYKIIDGEPTIDYRNDASMLHF
tara:strand:+ start:115 stop:819 length:705 start_codon:yes stop_codon:yes gene_type:complete